MLIGANHFPLENDWITLTINLFIVLKVAPPGSVPIIGK